jgi:hypothetical protein
MRNVIEAGTGETLLRLDPKDESAVLRSSIRPTLGSSPGAMKAA